MTLQVQYVSRFSIKELLHSWPENHIWCQVRCKKGHSFSFDSFFAMWICLFNRIPLQQFGCDDNDHGLCQSVSKAFAGTKPEPEEAVGCVVLSGSEAFRAELVRVWPVGRVVVDGVWVNADVGLKNENSECETAAG